jgi:hypothetical protein
VALRDRDALSGSTRSCSGPDRERGWHPGQWIVVIGLVDERYATVHARLADASGRTLSAGAGTGDEALGAGWRHFVVALQLPSSAESGSVRLEVGPIRRQADDRPSPR